jgi:hypothetical protein
VVAWEEWSVAWCRVVSESSSVEVGGMSEETSEAESEVESPAVRSFWVLERSPSAVNKKLNINYQKFVNLKFNSKI